MSRVRSLRDTRELDGIRAFAVFAVILYHVNATLTPASWPQLAPSGYLGVTVFFTLSGFLITALLLQERDSSGGVRLGRFYLRRARRLLPALVTMVGTVLMAELLLGLTGLRDAAYHAGAILLYIGNWVRVLDPRDLGLGLAHTWSLSVEGQFYLVWPVVVVLFLGARSSMRVRVVGLTVGVVGSYAVLWWASAPPHPEGGFRTDAQAYALLSGALLAVLWRAGITRSGVRHAAVPAGVVLLVLVLAPTPWPWQPIADGVAALASVVLIAACLERSGTPMTRARSVLAGRAPVHVGRISYALYLWHYPVFVLAAQLLTPWLRAPVALALTLCLAEVSTRFVEAPFYRRRVADPAVRVQPEPRIARGARAAAAPTSRTPLGEEARE